jgi:hypothetical protein
MSQLPPAATSTRLKNGASNVDPAPVSVCGECRPSLAGLVSPAEGDVDALGDLAVPVAEQLDAEQPPGGPVAGEPHRDAVAAGVVGLAANTLGRLVRMPRSTAIAPLAPSTAPALAARPVSGRTPATTRTMSWLPARPRLS